MNPNDVYFYILLRELDRKISTNLYWKLSVLWPTSFWVDYVIEWKPSKSFHWSLFFKPLVIGLMHIKYESIWCYILNLFLCYLIMLSELQTIEWDGKINVMMNTWGFERRKSRSVWRYYSSTIQKDWRKSWEISVRIASKQMKIILDISQTQI
jgi:hypothetical protein